MKIAVDFDGTIVKHAFPRIGRPLPFAFETLKALQKQGHLIILWTYRCGQQLDEAVDFCEKNGLVFYAVNKNDPEEIFDPSISRKILADIYIDDRNFNGFPGWGIIGQQLLKSEHKFKLKKEKKFFFKRKK